MVVILVGPPHLPLPHPLLFLHLLLPPSPSIPSSFLLLPINVQVNNIVIDEATFILPEDTVPVLDKDLAKRITIS